MNNSLIRFFGWPATVLQRDPTVYDRWRWLKRHLRSGPYRTLDAGCGAGEFTLYAALIGNEAIGLSFDEHLNQIGSVRANLLGIKQVQFLTVDLRQLDRWFESLGQFDQVICLETIEHILNDQKLINDLSYLLRPGGRLLLTTPYKGARLPPNARLSEYEDGGHVRWGYTHSEIEKIFQVAGITVFVEEYVVGFVSQKLTNLIHSSNSSRRKIMWVITFPLRLFQLFDSCITSWLKYPYLCIGIVGIKQAP